MSRHVVVVGHGMAAARLVEELRRRDPDGRALAVTVVGDERQPAYNRVLLSTVLAGGLGPEAVRLHPPGWAEKNHVDVRTGTRVEALDPAKGTLRCDSGEEIPYDIAVLATGAAPWLPPVAGLVRPDGRPAAGVVAFRTLDDCTAILRAASRPGARVAVLGGGLLGLEAARGLVRRGADVTVVHPAGHLMERQVDPGGGRALARAFSRLGVSLRLATGASAYVPERRGRGLVLDDGSFLPADVVVVSAGVRPDTRLAAEAGIAVSRGILVDDCLRTSDRRVRAIGDCAEHGGTLSGLVQPAWEQATVVADLLTGADPSARYHGSRVVTRLKADGVELAAMGAVDASDDDEVVELSDAARGRYARLVVRDDRVAGAVLVGSPEAAAAVSQHYDRATPLPSDRLGLLVGRIGPDAGETAPTPVRLPDRSVVCRCNNVTKAAITTAWQAGARDVDAVATATRATTGCGSCRDTVAGICEWLASADPQPHAAAAVGTAAQHQEGAA